MNEILGNIPPITKIIGGGFVLTSILTTLQLVADHDLFFNWELIVYEFEIWRILTSFTYIQAFDLFLLLHLYIL